MRFRIGNAHANGLSAARPLEHDMKATRLLWDDPGLTGAWAKLAQALLFDRLRRDTVPQNRPPQAPTAGFFSRLDAWLSRQARREREAYLAGARDIYELEERIRRLERSAGSGFN
jgi:hypothetical protein